MPTTILLVRHGETDWNRDRRVQGHTDVPLNEEGRRQARELSRRLADEVYDAIYASDLSRAFETATILAEPRSLEVRALQSLREKDFGRWEGLTRAEVRTLRGSRTGALDGTESAAETAARTVDAILGIAAAHAGQTVLVVTHRGPLRAALRHCGATDGRVGNCEVARVVVENESMRRVD